MHLDLMPLTYISRSIDFVILTSKIGFICTYDSCVCETLHTSCPSIQLGLLPLAFQGPTTLLSPKVAANVKHCI